MKGAQFETLVLEAVTRLRAGGAKEDDRVEFKRAWPSVDKARQLAAAANTSGGDYLIYVIGVDERDGSIHVVPDGDPASWWAKFESAFDEVAPELERHLNVQVSETEAVVALLFRTDRSPYVIKVVNGGQTEREVPIRVGTRTRSAHRHELLRLLYPATRVPTLSAIDGNLSLGSDDDYPPNEKTFRLFMHATIYYEHVDSVAAFFPRHSMTISLKGDRLTGVTGPSYTVPENPSRWSSGILLRHDGIEVRGPGAAYLQADFRFALGRLPRAIAVDEWLVRIEFGVAGQDAVAATDIRFGNRTATPHWQRKEELEYEWKVLPPAS